MPRPTRLGRARTTRGLHRLRSPGPYWPRSTRLARIATPPGPLFRPEEPRQPNRAPTASTWQVAILAASRQPQRYSGDRWSADRCYRTSESSVRETQCENCPCPSVVNVLVRPMRRTEPPAIFEKGGARPPSVIRIVSLDLQERVHGWRNGHGVHKIPGPAGSPTRRRRAPA